MPHTIQVGEREGESGKSHCQLCVCVCMCSDEWNRKRTGGKILIFEGFRPS